MRESSCEQDNPATSARLIAVLAMIVDRYARYVLLIAINGGSPCGPKTRTMCDACRMATLSAYDMVQQTVGVHHASGNNTKIDLSIASCAPLQMVPEIAKNRN